MADYYPLLSRAIINLGESAGPDVRRAIYDRARTTLRSQLEGAEPPIPEGEIERERAQLEAVIARLEIEARARLKAASPLPLRYDDAPPEAQEDGRAPEADELHAAPEPAAETADAIPVPRDIGAASGTRRADGPLPDRPIDTKPRRRSVLDWRKGALAAAALVVVGGIGSLAYALRDQVDPTRREQAEQAAAANPTPPQTAPDAKITTRLGGQSAPSAPVAPAASPDTSQPIAVAQRATLFIEVPGATDQVPRTVAGRVVWGFANLPSKPGKPLDPAFVGTVEIPDAGITLKLQMTRNRDRSLPASYLIGLIFTTKDSTVKEIAPVLMKTDESERGAPLVGIQQSLGPNLFVMALSADDSDIAKNFDLLSKRGWVEIQFRLADQRRGALVFEKGIAGDRALLASIDAWK
jgi:hypothetical protein